MYFSDNSGDKLYLNQNSELQVRNTQEERSITKNFDIQLYPNPSSQGEINLFIQGLNSEERINIIASDFQGKTYFIIIELADQNPIRLNIQSLPNGLYSIQVRLGNLARTTKLIISKHYD